VRWSNNRLACFDSYDLALNCAQFRCLLLPVLVISAMCLFWIWWRHTSLKTPTAVAEFLISNLQQAENQLLDIFSDISYLVKNKLESEKSFVASGKDPHQADLAKLGSAKEHIC